MEHLLFLWCIAATDPATKSLLPCTQQTARGVIDAGLLLPDENCGAAVERWHQRGGIAYSRTGREYLRIVCEPLR